MQNESDLNIGEAIIDMNDIAGESLKEVGEELVGGQDNVLVKEDLDLGKDQGDDI